MNAARRQRPRMRTMPAAAEQWLRRLEDTLRRLESPKAAEDAAAEIRAHLEDTAREAGESGVAAVLASLGSPEAYAEALASGEEPAPSLVEGTVGGVPYRLLPPDAKGFAARWWDPRSTRVFMPRALGLGWDLNFGRIAVLLGIVDPDDEDEAFAHTPDAAITAGFAGAVVLQLATLAAVLVYRDLPRFPTHWGLTEPDAFSTGLSGGLWVISPSLVLTVVLGLAVFARRRSRLARALSSAALVSATVLTTLLYGDGLAWALTGRTPVNPGFLVLLGLASLFGMLVLYSKLGSRGERRAQSVR